MPTPLEQKLTALIQPLLKSEGVDLVQLTLLGEGRGTVLQILAENTATGTLDLDTCTRLSRTIGTHLEVEDLIKAAYRLEISSPGIDRPLTQPAHFTRYIGQQAKIETTLPVDGGRRFHGRIKNVDLETVDIEQDDQEIVTLEFANISRAKLKMSDELMAALAPPGSKPPQPKKRLNTKGERPTS
jgi:ribosome maturation factor RimP